MSHLEKILDETFGNKKPKQVEVAVDRLHPPMAPKPIASEISVEDTGEIGKGSPQQPDSKLAIDFSYLANNSSFQRSIIEFIKKFVPGFENVDARGSKKTMAKSFDQNVVNYRESIKLIKEGNIKLVEKGTFTDEELGADDDILDKLKERREEDNE